MGDVPAGQHGLLSPVLRSEEDAPAYRIGDMFGGIGLTVEPHLTGTQGVSTHDAAGHLRLAGADEAQDAGDLTGSKGNVDGAGPGE